MTTITLTTKNVNIAIGSKEMEIRYAKSKIGDFEIGLERHKNLFFAGGCPIENKKGETTCKRNITKWTNKLKKAEAELVELKAMVKN